MFNIEEILGIKIDKSIMPLEHLTNIILLVPEAIEDAISKINKLGFVCKRSLTFVNGYAVVNNDSFINKKGEIVKCKNGKIFGTFSCDHITCSTGFIDGRTGKQLNLIVKPLSVKPFSEGLAPIEVAYGVWNYIDLSGKIYRPIEAALASCFFNGYAIIKRKKQTYDIGESGYKWEIINRDFKVVQSSFSSNENDFYFESLLHFFDHNPNLSKEDESVKKIHNGDFMIFIDTETDFSIRVYEILKTISKHFNIPLSKGSVREQLIDIISKVATKGNFALNTKTLTVCEVEVVKGVKVYNDGSRGEISFGSKDLDLLKLTRKEKNQGE